MHTRLSRGLTATMVATAISIASVAGAAEPGKLFMWRVQSKATTVHLLGTIHVAKPELYPLDPAIESTFEQSSTLVVEADITAVHAAEIQKLMAEHGRYPAGETLKDHLEAALVKRLEAYMDERSMPFEAMQTMRPWLVAVMLGALELERLGYKPEHGIDLHFLNQAKAADTRILELESTMFQVELFASFSPALQASLLAYQLEQSDDVGAQAAAITAAWQHGNTATIDSLFLSYDDDDPTLSPLIEKMLDDRNVAMAEKIRGYLDDPDHTYFVLVGAGHMVGPMGLVSLLEDRAYRIDQVNATVAEPARVDN